MSPVDRMLQGYLDIVDKVETGDVDQPPRGAALTDLSRWECWHACRCFVDAVQRVLGVNADLVDWYQAGIDLYLTRNGHGTGFWDRPELYGDNNALLFTALAAAQGHHDVTFKDGEESNV